MAVLSAQAAAFSTASAPGMIRPLACVASPAVRRPVGGGRSGAASSTLALSPSSLAGLLLRGGANAVIKIFYSDTLGFFGGIRGPPTRDAGRDDCDTGPSPGWASPQEGDAAGRDATSPRDRARDPRTPPRGPGGGGGKAPVLSIFPDVKRPSLFRFRENNVADQPRGEKSRGGGVGRPIHPEGGDGGGYANVVCEELRMVLGGKCVASEQLRIQPNNE